MDTGYDLIGDIHGYAEELERLLNKMGYQEIDGVYRHEQRQVIFLGDLIDRGPNNRRVIEIAQRMCASNNAKIIMGNHEYNAICYHTQDAQGQPLRPHTQRNFKQHQTFLEQFPTGESATQNIIEWFKSLPLALELPGFNVVHACWSPSHLSYLHQLTKGSYQLQQPHWALSLQAEHPLFDAIESVLKGPELALPEPYQFRDAGGHERKNIRIKWWQQQATSYRDYALVPASAQQDIPNLPLPENLAPTHYTIEKPTFFGHYWMTGTPSIKTHYAACLDYSVAAKSGHGKLTAYRWSGESQLNTEHFCWIERLATVG